MIVDLNIYRSHRAVQVLDNSQAIADETARRYLYEAIGLEPWLGSETPHGPEKRAGEHYFQLTPKGLTKELGYVGNYGEVLDWVGQIYDAARRTTRSGRPEDQGPDARTRMRARLSATQR